MERIIKFWFMQVSRGYTLPMSITNWLVVFSLALLNNGNVLYGILALIGFMFAHLGTNVFDDFIDHLTKVPKQKYKSVHLTIGATNLKTILILAIVYFLIAACIGLFLTVKCGYMVAVLAVIGGCIALLYPKLNNFALGEIAVGLAFGVLLFAGVYYVMTGAITKLPLLLSIPVSIFTVAVLMVHSLMDYDFDINSKKKTLCILVGSKYTALNMIFSFMIVAYFITFMLVYYNLIPLMTLASFGSIVILIPLYHRLLQYISTTEHAEDDFIKNFGLTRNIGTIYCLTITAALLIEKFIIQSSSNIVPYMNF